MGRYHTAIAFLLNALITVHAERVNVDFVPESLPTLDCPTYETVTDAKQSCQGTFLMWGQYFADASNQSKISLLDFGDGSEIESSANSGPYYCSGCSTNSTAHYGFVGGKENEALPGVIFGFSEVEDLPTSVYCTGEDVDVETMEDLSCGALQRYCEEQKLGWLTYASTFETATGVFTCSGGCAGESLFASQKISPLPGNDTDYFSWPMIVMWSMIGFFLLASAVLDFRLFEGTFLAWMKRYYLHMFGYINIKGERMKFCSVFKNPFECLCFFCERGERSSVLWFRFLSVTIISFGVSILFGDGSKHEHVCFFDSTQSEATPLYSNVLEDALWTDFYGQKDGPGVGDWPVLQFGVEWVVSELAIVLFSTAQEMLLFNIMRGEMMKDIVAALVMLLFSSVFTICAYLYYLKEVHLENLYILWLALMAVSYVVIPIFGANAYGIAALTVRCFGWEIPEPVDESSRKSTSTRNSTSSRKSSKVEPMYVTGTRKSKRASDPKRKSTT